MAATRAVAVIPASAGVEAPGSELLSSVVADGRRGAVEGGRGVYHRICGG